MGTLFFSFHRGRIERMWALFALFSLAAASSIEHPAYLAGNTNRIVNGQNSVEGQFPWQVSMQQFGRHFCGASLVANNFVMCAAHCVQRVTGITANLGAIDYHNPEQSISVSVWTAHPQYNSRTLDYDFSVAKLSSDATLTANVGLIALAASATNMDYSGMASTSGWGYTTQIQQSTPNDMQFTDIPLVSQADCQAVWGDVIEITDRIQCAGGNGVSSCMGDSGGPLTIVENGVTTLIGAVSWVQSRCSPNYPGGYAKIASVRPWIDQQMAM